MKIPKVEKGKVVILRTDNNTGKIVNNDGSYYNSEGELYYQILDSIEKAREYGQKEVKKGLFEVLIYDDQGGFIEIHKENGDVVRGNK